MSTKIYDAWITPAGLPAIIRGLKSLRADVLKLSSESPRFFLSSGDAGHEPTLREFLLLGSRAIVSQEHGTLACSAVIYAHPTDSAFQIVHFFGVQRGLDEAKGKLLRRWKAREFGFQNQTDDLPRGVTAAQYRKRGKTWDRILGENGIPSQAGLSFDLLTVEEEMEGFLTRLRKTAWPPPENPDPQALRWWSFAVARDAVREIRAGQGKQWVERLMDSRREILAAQGKPISPPKPEGPWTRKRAFAYRIQRIIDSRRFPEIPVDASTLLLKEAMRLAELTPRKKVRSARLPMRMAWAYQLSAARLEAMCDPATLVRFQKITPAP